MLIGVLGCVAMRGQAGGGWGGLAGFAGAVLLTLALALPSMLAADVPRLAAAMFIISYGLSTATA